MKYMTSAVKLLRNSEETESVDPVQRNENSNSNGNSNAKIWFLCPLYQARSLPVCPHCSIESRFSIGKVGSARQTRCMSIPSFCDRASGVHCIFAVNSN